MPRIAGALLRTQADDRLAELAGEGNRAAFEELAGRYRSRLVAFAATVGPPSSADDVVQDAMLRAYLALTRGDRPEFPRAWLFTIVRNTALNHRRSWHPHEELDETIDGVEQPPQAAERRGRFAALIAGLGELPASQRDAIVQRELEGRGHDEIAGSLGVSPAAVRQLIFRARTTLRAGVGALVPTALLRIVSLPGAVETGAGAGIAVGAAKFGVAAVIATGAIVGGVEVERAVDDGGKPDAAVAAPVGADAAAAGTPASFSEDGAGVEDGGPAGSGGRSTRLADLESGLGPNRDSRPPTHRQERRPRPEGSQPPPGGGSQGQTQQQPPPQQGQQSGSGGHQQGGTTTAFPKPPPPPLGASRPPGG